MKWIYIDGVAHEVGSDYTGTPRHNRVHGDLHYQDCKGPQGENLTTRTKHREFMKQTGLTTADDFKGYWANEQQARVNGRPDPAIRKTLEREFHRRFVK